MDAGTTETPRLEEVLGTVMRADVYGSALCLLAGLLAWLVQHESAAAAVLLKVGLIALMAAPGMRVLISAIEAVRLKDWHHLATILAVAGLLALAVATASRT